MALDVIMKLQFGADVGMTVLIWMVQLIIYPGFRNVVPERFHDWHLQYMKTISRIVIPMMMLQLLSHGLISVMQPSLLQWLAFATILGAWMVTFTLSVPCHRQLQKAGYRIEIINRLVNTNWLRTICWTVTLILGFLSERI